MKRSSRLTRSEDIRRVRKDGRAFAHPMLVLVCLPNDFGENRTAVIAGRSVGGAVQRNFAKRRIRSAFQFFQDSLNLGYDLVLIARRALIKTDYQSLLSTLAMLLSRAGLMKDFETID